MTVTTPEIEQQTDSEPNAPITERPKQRTPMTVINFWLDVCLLVNVVIFMWVSTVMRVVFPPPTYAGGWVLWGMGYDQWDNLRFGSLCIFTLLALEHIVFHWNWVCNVLVTRVLKIKNRPDEGTQAVYGVGTFSGILLAIFVSLAVAYVSIKEPPSQFAPSSEAVKSGKK